MSGVERIPPTSPESRPKKAPDPKAAAPAEERPAKEKGAASARFRFARLDGRDTLKYEDTADK
jgi:hypothetical protein